MNWTMAEFFSDGGTTRFVDRLASSLGIPSYRIKVVSVYEGSVVFDFAVEQEPVATTTTDASGNTVALPAATIAANQASALAALTTLETTLTTQASTGTLSVGAPVMGLAKVDSSTGTSKLLAGDPIPEPPSRNPTIQVPVVTDNSGNVMVPSGAYSMVAAWIAVLALAAHLF